MASIKFTRVAQGNLGTIPITDGQIIFTRDTGNMYYDFGNQRYKTTDYIEVHDIAVLTSGINGKLYYNRANNALYTWNSIYNVFKKVVNVTAADVVFSGSGLTAANIGDAVNELKGIVDSKADKAVAGAGGVTKSVTPAGTTDGISIATVQLSLTDGTSATITTQVTLDQMGAASKSALNAVDAKVDTKASQVYVDSGLAGKVDKGMTGGPIVKDITITGSPQTPDPATSGGIQFTKNFVNIENGAVSSASGSVSAQAMGAATINQFTDLQAQIDTIRGGLLRFALNFELVFGTATPDITKTDTWLAARIPPVIPTVGTALKNNNPASPTFQHVFVYYNDPNNSPHLMLVDDGIDSVTTATATTLGVVRGAGDIFIDNNGDMFINSGTIGLSDLSPEVQAVVDGKVDKTQTINGKALIGNVTLGAADIGFNGASSGIAATETQGAINEVKTAVSSLTTTVSNKVDKVPTATTNNVAVFVPGGGIKDGGAMPVITGLMPKVSSATPGNIAVFTTGGELEDSGKTVNDLIMSWVDGDL